MGQSEDHAFTCAACGMKIHDRYYLLAVDKQWHVNCLTCAECQQPMDSQATCFSKDGHIFCKDDYYRYYIYNKQQTHYILYI